MKKLQKILNENGFSHIKVIDRDTVQAVVDGEKEIFSRSDRVTGEQMSGLRFYGSVYGDWRMIEQIAEDMEAVFNLLK